MRYTMKFWKKKKPRELEIQELFDDITQLTDSVHNAAIDLSVLTRTIEITEDEWHSYCIKMKKVNK